MDRLVLSPVWGKAHHNAARPIAAQQETSLGIFGC
jgi:hypothetical protein